MKGVFIREHPAPSGALRRQRSARRRPARSWGQGAPSTIRCIMTRRQLVGGDGLLEVREHPAPSGALRRNSIVESSIVDLHQVREHPAPSGALRPCAARPLAGSTSGQGAPSTIRCIKTPTRSARTVLLVVREHPAPSGALRRCTSAHIAISVPRQGAPSTIRCIKTASARRRHT